MQQKSEAMKLGKWAESEGISVQNARKHCRNGVLGTAAFRGIDGVWLVHPQEASAALARNRDLTTAPHTVLEAAASNTPVRKGKRASAPTPSPEVGTPEELAVASARRMSALADLAQMQRDEQCGRLTDAAAVERRWGDILTASRDKLLGVPTAFKQAHPELPLSLVQSLEDLIREALTDLGTGRAS